MSEEDPYQAPATEPDSVIAPFPCPECGTTMETGVISGNDR